MAKLGNTKVWGRSYTTIPFAVRSILEIDNGDELEWFLEGGVLIIRKKVLNHSKNFEDSD